MAWRLARQLRWQFGLTVRLYLDDWYTLARLLPGVEPGRKVQSIQGVELRGWDQDSNFFQQAGEGGWPAVVIETFGCYLPKEYLQALAGGDSKAPAILWINLEYLSAEGWVQGCHLLPSPHSHGGLRKFFFFPGFNVATGGLLREAGLLQRRHRLEIDPGLQRRCWQGWGLAPPLPGTMVVMLFGYDTPAVNDLLTAWHGGPTPVRCLMPQGEALTRRARRLVEQAGKRGGEGYPGSSSFLPGRPVELLRWGSLEWGEISFLPQRSFDRLLWCADLVGVRGEDSLVRAQWAARPLLWQIYPQAGGAHWNKLESFLELYLQGLDAGVAERWTRLFRAWNGSGDAGQAWSDLITHYPQLRLHANTWCEKLAEQPDLASQLVRFASKTL